MKHVVLTSLALTGIVLVSLWAFQRSLIYVASRGPVPSAGEVIDGARDVTLKTSDGLELHAWFVPAHAPDKGFTVLVANGNAGDRSVRSPLAVALAEEGFSVLLFDYRGYGDNPGSPSEDGLARDVRAAYRFLIGMGKSNDRLLYYGESLGAGVVTELATEHPPAGLLLRSPFTDLAAVGQLHYPYLPVRALLRDRYPIAEHVRRLDVPTTVVYGTEDSIVPPEESRAVAQAAGEGTTIVEVEGADHNDRVLLNGPELIDAVADLATRIGYPS